MVGQSFRQSPHEASGLLDGVEYRGLAVTKQTWLKKVYCGPERKLIETS